jgi:hypothetical protein
MLPDDLRARPEVRVGVASIHCVDIPTHTRRVDTWIYATQFATEPHQLLFPRETLTLLPVINRSLGDRRPLKYPFGEIRRVQVALELARRYRP